jgi:hypothetical protein
MKWFCKKIGFHTQWPLLKIGARAALVMQNIRDRSAETSRLGVVGATLGLDLLCALAPGEEESFSPSVRAGALRNEPNSDSPKESLHAVRSCLLVILLRIEPAIINIFM